MDKVTELNSKEILKINKNFRQIPFTRALIIEEEDFKLLGEQLYFLCSARI